MTATDKATARATEVRLGKKLRHEMNKHVKGAGTCVDTIFKSLGDGWFAFFDGEFAALRAHYVYRNTPNISLGFSENLGLWYVSNKH